MTKTNVNRPIQPPPARVRLIRLKPLLGYGLALSRYYADSAVWLLALEIEPLLGASTWRLRQLHPELDGGEFTRRLRLAEGPQHTRRVFSLPAVRNMALTRSGEAARALLGLVSDEIDAGRHYSPERPPL